MKPKTYSEDYMNPSFDIVRENPSHNEDIDALHAQVFGPGRFARTAFRVREGYAADPRFSFVAFDRLDDRERLIGSVRLTMVMIGQARAYLLGPLCVAKDKQSRGYGRALVRKAVETVMEIEALPVILVGDAPYYQPLGFERAPTSIKMPGPVDYARLLVRWPQKAIDEEGYRGIMKAMEAPVIVG